MSSQIGVASAQAASSLAVHSTQVFVAEHAGSSAVHRLVLLVVHSTHAPDTAQTVPTGQLLPLHATQ
jgi:hypothetical protein